MQDRLYVQKPIWPFGLLNFMNYLFFFFNFGCWTKQLANAKKLNVT